MINHIIKLPKELKLFVTFIEILKIVDKKNPIIANLLPFSVAILSIKIKIPKGSPMIKNDFKFICSSDEIVINVFNINPIPKAKNTK